MVVDSGTIVQKAQRQTYSIVTPVRNKRKQRVRYSDMVDNDTGSPYVIGKYRDAVGADGANNNNGYYDDEHDIGDNGGEASEMMRMPLLKKR